MLEKKCSARKLSHLQYFQPFMFRSPFTLVLAYLTFNTLILTVSASSREKWCVQYSWRIAKESLWNIKELNPNLSPTKQPPPTADPIRQSGSYTGRTFLKHLQSEQCLTMYVGPPTLPSRYAVNHLKNKIHEEMEVICDTSWILFQQGTAGCSCSYQDKLLWQDYPYYHIEVGRVSRLSFVLLWEKMKLTELTLLCHINIARTERRRWPLKLV